LLQRERRLLSRSPAVLLVRTATRAPAHIILRWACCAKGRMRQLVPFTERAFRFGSYVTRSSARYLLAATPPASARHSTPARMNSPYSPLRSTRRLNVDVHS